VFTPPVERKKIQRCLLHLSRAFVIDGRIHNPYAWLPASPGAWPIGCKNKMSPVVWLTDFISGPGHTHANIHAHPGPRNTSKTSVPRELGRARAVPLGFLSCRPRALPPRLLSPSSSPPLPCLLSPSSSPPVSSRPQALCPLSLLALELSHPVFYRPRALTPPSLVALKLLHPPLSSLVRI
jgi:hypothetical protein